MSYSALQKYVEKRAAKKGVSQFILKGIKGPGKAKKYRQMQESVGTSTESLLGDIVKWPVEKLVGKERVQKALWKGYKKPSLHADIALGRGLQKIPGAKNLFTQKEWVRAGPGKKELVERASALAPIGKLRKLTEPVIMGLGTEQAIKAFKPEQKKTAMDKKVFLDKIARDKKLREKAASLMLSLADENRGHRKRAHATRLFYRQVELGQEELPRSYSAFQQKVASLMKNEDLKVLEKALEIVGRNDNIGEISNAFQPGSLNASESFQAAILNLET